MADQTQNQHATYQYMLDGTGLSLDIDRSSQGFQNQNQSHSSVQGQNQAQMSPPSGAGATHSAFMYHPFPHAPQASYTPSLHQGSHAMNADETQTLTLDPAQLRTPSSGPSRVLTRRQARMAAAHPYSNAPQQNQQQQQQANEGFGLFGASATSPRPQTPNSFHTGAQLAGGRIGLPDLNIGQITIPNGSALSPQHPSTPASVTSSSNFSQYGFAQYANNGHSRSGSSSTHPRSTSPAASVVSAATSLSSGSDPKIGRSRPPVSAGSAGCMSIASIGYTDTITVKPKRRLQNRQRKEICQYFLENPNSRQEDIAARWGVERSTVSKILKHKNRWMAVQDGDDQVMAKHRPPKFAEIECRMESWLVECRDSGTQISDAMIRAKAREYARELHIPEDKFKASAGWVENYKHRANIKKGIWQGRPSPGTYSDDECDIRDAEGPFLHEVLDERRRLQALKEADERIQRAAEGLETNMEIAGIELNPSPVALNPAGEWPPSFDLTFGDNNSTNRLELQTQMISMNNLANQQKDNQSTANEQPQTTFSTGGNILQQRFAAPRTSWTPNGGAPNMGVIEGSLPVSAQEARSAMDIVLRFVQTQSPEFLTERDKNLLTDIKHLIWCSANQAASATAASSLPATANAGVMTTGHVVHAAPAGGSMTSTGVSLGGEPVSAPAA